MHTFRLYFLLTWLLACAFGAAPPVTQETYGDNSYAWTAWVDDTVEPGPNVMRENALAAFNSMDAQYQQMKEFQPALRRPTTMAVLYVIGRGYAYSSSIRGASATSEATQGIFGNTCTHKYQGNCAEMGAIALAGDAPHNINIAQTRAFITVYGENPQTGERGYPPPCSPNGCAQYLSNNNVIPVKRSEGEFGTKQVLAAIGFQA